MNSDRGFPSPGDINANISLKDFAETSDERSGVCCFFKAESELLEFPFFEEDISKVFEIKTNLNTKKRKRKTFFKRRWYFRKYRSRNVKKSVRTTLIATQENGHVELKNTGIENKEDLEIKSAQDYSLPSGELKVCDVETNRMIKQTPHFYSSTSELNDIQTSREMKPESYVTENTKPSINKEDSIVSIGCPGTAVSEDEHRNKTNTKMKKDENCQPSEEGEKPEKECEVTQDSSLETEKRGSGDGNSDIQINNVQQLSSGKRLRPNYFVAIPVTNDEILDLIEDVQEHIVLKEPKLLRALIPAEKVHITILVAHLKTEDIKRAISALLQSKEKVENLLHGKPFGLPLHGVGEFNNQVVYIKITEREQEQLSKIAEVVTQCFINEGVDITGSKDFKPHLTFLKLSKAPSLRRKGFRRICSELYKEYEDFSFGTEMFSRIDLCSMHKKNKESGYYYCESSILIDGIVPYEENESITEIKQDFNDPVSDRETSADSSITSSLAKDADQISLDIADALTISKKEEIKETDGQPEAANANLGEKSCFQSTPALFPAEPIASTAVDDRPEKQN